MDEVDPELIKTFNKLGIPLEEQMALSGMAVDAVMDSVSVLSLIHILASGMVWSSSRLSFRYTAILSPAKLLVSSML